MKIDEKLKEYAENEIGKDASDESIIKFYLQKCTILKDEALEKAIIRLKNLPDTYNLTI